jgi:hypothetical protein
VPVVVVFATAYGLPLVLGLDPQDIVLFATYLFLACVPGGW